jgi:hypothetical protein
MSKPSIGFLVAMAATLAPVAPAAAQQMETATPPGDRWTIEVAPYLWIASMDGNATVGGIKSDVDVPFSDLLKDLSGGLMTAVDVERGRFGIGLNGLFARVSSDADVGSTEIDVTSDSGQLAVLPFYRLVEWQYGTSSSGAPLRLIVPRPAFASRTCAPSSRFAAARPSTAPRTGSIP